MWSSITAPVTAKLLDRLQQQDADVPLSILVIRTEHLKEVDRAVANRPITILRTENESWVSTEPLDEALHHVFTEYAIILSTDLSPVDSCCIHNLMEPLLKGEEIIATLGTIVAEPDVPQYDAYRYEDTAHDPLKFVCFQMQVWDIHPLKNSGSHGVRWCSRIQQEGQIARVGSARMVGRPLQTNASFEDIFRKHWSNYPITVTDAIRTTIQETLQDWEGIRDKNVTDPAPMYVRAAIVRTAENFGKTELGRIIRGG